MTMIVDVMMSMLNSFHRDHSIFVHVWTLCFSSCAPIRNSVSHWLHVKRILEHNFFFFKFVESDHLMVEYGNDLL